MPLKEINSGIPMNYNIKVYNDKGVYVNDLTCHSYRIIGKTLYVDTIGYVGRRKVLPHNLIMGDNYLYSIIKIK